MLNFLIAPINNLLIFLYGISGQNLGLAIIFLTLIVRGVLVPITIPSLRSAKKLQELKPHLDKLKQKHKDKQKLQLATLELYKQHGINPAAGCLPQIAQLLVLIALYQVFINFINGGQYNGQSLNLNFLWLDLGKADPYYILPVLMGASMILTMKMTSTTTDPQQAKIMMFMNIAFIFLFAWLPAGLLLYITLSNLLSIVQQLLVRRRISAAAR